MMVQEGLNPSTSSRFMASSANLTSRREIFRTRSFTFSFQKQASNCVIACVVVTSPYKKS
jgi:hypothetical protein